MNKTTFPASHAPARVPIRSRNTNLAKLFEPEEVAIKQFSNSHTFDKNNVISQIRNFCNTAIERIEKDCVVSLNIDEVGAHLNVLDEDFQFSFIYKEGGIS